MKQKTTAFLLSIPYPLLKKTLYLYLGAIAMWTWSAAASLVLLVIILAALLLIGWQSSAWTSAILREHSSREEQPYIERLRAPNRSWLPRLIIILGFSGLFAYFFNGFLGLNLIQLFLLPVGYALLYRETVLMGAYVTYIATSQGIGIEFIPGHFVYRTFIHYEEIQKILVCKSEHHSTRRRDALYLTPLLEEEKGLLFEPFRPRAFSSQGDTIFISPRNLDRFIAHLPGHLIRKTEAFI